MKMMHDKCPHGGFTLVEVVLSIGMFVIIIAGLLQLAAGTASMNKKMEQAMAGSMLATNQYNYLLGVASNTNLVNAAGNAPKALILYLRSLNGQLPGSDFPYSVDYNGQSGVLRYEFMIPEPGQDYIHFENSNDVIDAIKSSYNPRARGVAEIYLRENDVPDHFFDWQTHQWSASGDILTAPNINYFDMDEDGKSGGDFSGLFTGGNPNFAANNLVKLPMSITVTYYKDAAHAVDSNNALTTVQRHYILNDSSILAGVTGRGIM